MIRCLAYIKQAEMLMSSARSLTVLCILVLCFAFTASAQKTRKKPVPRATPRPTPIAVNPVVAVAKLQVSNQLHNVNVFIDKMGPIAIALENADKDASAGKLKKEFIAANEANKKKIIAAIRGMRDGLVALETDFRTKPQLAQYLLKLQGISTLSAQSEDKAIAGQFVASKDPLRQIALKLNDTMAVLPGPVTDGPTLAPAQNRALPAPNPAQPSNAAPNRTISTSNPPVTTAKQDPSIGMTTAEVLLTSWGKPIDKRTSGSPNGTTEVWVYSGNRILYFFNGILTNIKR
jgi:hypothetical protein